MLLQSVIIDPADIGHRMSGPVILVVRVFTAKALIPIYFRQYLNKLLTGVWDVPDKLIIKLQNAGPVHISCPLVIHLDVGIQPFPGVFLSRCHLIQFDHHLV